MNPSRRTVIRELLAEKPFVALKELEKIFPDVSSMTLRRDIEYFEKQGEAIKVRGGARSMKYITTTMEDSFHKRLGENLSAKEKIARCAIELIETGRSLFLDSGTTVLTLASLLPDERHTIITTGPNIALELIKKKKPIARQGKKNWPSYSATGSTTRKRRAAFRSVKSLLHPMSIFRSLIPICCLPSSTASKFTGENT